METTTKKPLHSGYLAKDRFDHSEYRIDQNTYHYILEMINFYHESIYELPDEEVIHTEKVEGDHTVRCNVPVNHLVF